MKKEDIDKRIGMPDVDAEWARFEREVIGKNTKPGLRRVSAWAGGIGVAAAIALLFVLNMGKDDSTNLTALAKQTEEQPQVTPSTEEQSAVAQQLSESPQPNRPDENNVSMRLSSNNPHEDDSVLVVIDGNPILLTVSWFAEKTVEEIGRGLQVDIDDIMIYKDEARRQFYIEQYGELAKRAKRGVCVIKTKAAPSTYDIKEYEGLANVVTEEALQGRIAGLDLTDKPLRFVRETDRPALPYLWERDTVLTLVNGKEDPDFLRYLSDMSHWSMNNVYDYFFERNQLFLMQSLPSKELQVALYDPSLFESHDIRLVVDYLTKPFTPVSQLTPEQIKSRRLAYLQNKYRVGFSKNSNQDCYAPDLYDTPTEERLFGLTAAKCRSYGQQHEYFGSMDSDSHGIYVPLIRDVVMTTHDDAWWENGEIWILKDDPHFNQIVDDILRTATRAESSAVTSGDSIVRLAFIFGGKVIEGQQNDLISGMQKKLYKQVKKSSFAFKPDEDAPSWWWGEAYYSTTSQRQLWMHLHSVDKLYATDCPELLSNRRHVEGTVTDEKGEPLTEALVSISTHVTPWDATKTDSKGHFDMWIPFRDATIRVNHSGYKPIQTQPADTTLIFRMKDATKIKEVKVLRKEEIKKFEGIQLPKDSLKGRIG